MLGNGIATSVVAGEGAINPFAKWSGGLAWADGKSHADGVVLPLQCGGGGSGTTAPSTSGPTWPQSGPTSGIFRPKNSGAENSQ
jgi:hypothetical protein